MSFNVDVLFVLCSLMLRGFRVKSHGSTISSIPASTTFMPRMSQGTGFCRRSMATKDGYIHKTVIPMSHFQDSLPRLPLPKLEVSTRSLIIHAIICCLSMY